MLLRYLLTKSYFKT